MLEKLEDLSKNRKKVPIRTNDGQVTRKIGRENTDDLLERAQNMQTIGALSGKKHHMHDIMTHSYLQKSLEQRVQRKALYKEYLHALKQNYSSACLKQTKASRLRS
jgi:hypothetical protein